MLQLVLVLVLLLALLLLVLTLSFQLRRAFGDPDARKRQITGGRSGAYYITIYAVCEFL